MNQKQFIKKILGKPWINRASSFDSADCWGLVILYYKHVLNVELPMVQGFTDNDDFNSCYQRGVDQWEEQEAPYYEGLVFTCYNGDNPTHVGLYIGHGKVLHSRGSDGNEGKVEIHSVRAIQSVYGKMTFHKFIG